MENALSHCVTRATLSFSIQVSAAEEEEMLLPF